MIVPGDYHESGARIIGQLDAKDGGPYYEAYALNTLRQKLRGTIVSDSRTAGLPIIDAAEVARWRPKCLCRDGYGNVAKVYAYLDFTGITGTVRITVNENVGAYSRNRDISADTSGWTEITNTANLSLGTSQEYLDLDISSTIVSGGVTTRKIQAVAIQYVHGAISVLPVVTAGSAGYSFSSTIPFDLAAFAGDLPMSSYWPSEMHRAAEFLWEHRTGQAWGWSQPVTPVSASSGTIQSIAVPDCATSLRVWWYVTTATGKLTVTTPAASATVTSPSAGWNSTSVTVTPGELNDVLLAGESAYFDSSSAYYIDGAL